MNFTNQELFNIVNYSLYNLQNKGLKTQKGWEYEGEFNTIINSIENGDFGKFGIVALVQNGYCQWEIANISICDNVDQENFNNIVKTIVEFDTKINRINK